MKLITSVVFKSCNLQPRCWCLNESRKHQHKISKLHQVERIVNERGEKKRTEEIAEARLVFFFHQTTKFN